HGGIAESAYSRGYQEKARTARTAAARPQAATIARSSNSKPEPVWKGLKAAWQASERCFTGKMSPRIASQRGGSSRRTKTSEMNRIGSAVALATAGAASAFGVNEARARPRALNAAAPTTTESANAGTARAGRSTP